MIKAAMNGIGTNKKALRMRLRPKPSDLGGVGENNWKIIHLLAEFLEHDVRLRGCVTHDLVPIIDTSRNEEVSNNK